MACSSVTGLEIAYDEMQYRSGSALEYGDQKSPGRPRYPNVVMERPIAAGDNEFYEWMNTIRKNDVERRNVTISLLDEEHEPLMTWKVKNAFPVRLTGPELDARGKGPATETLELSHEGLVVDAHESE
jgi:phage tail-like protein